MQTAVVEWGWPNDVPRLEHLQATLAREAPPPWRPSGVWTAGACSAVFANARAVEPERGWAGAVLGQATAAASLVLPAGLEYRAGRLALREGPLLEAAVRLLPALPDVLIVPATGRDHPRRAGLAHHLGAVLGIPTVGVTEEPLLATGGPPGPERAARCALRLEGEVVGQWLRTRAGARPVAVHAAWRTDPEVAVEVVLATTGAYRFPEPLRQARAAARQARANAS